MTILNNDILKVGIIGCGLIGNKRAAVIKNDPTSVLSAASDVNVINGAVLLRQCGAGAGGRACRDWRDMLNEEKLDAVIVATPNKYLKKISLWEKGGQLPIFPAGKRAQSQKRQAFNEIS